MAAGGYVVEGRQFRVKADYEAALRDKEIIDEIRSRVDFKKRDEVLKLYSELESGKYTFESLVGNDFDDEVFELVQTIRKGSFTEEKPAAGKKKGKKEKTQKKAVTLESFDANMQKQILLELKKREKRRKRIVFFCSFTAIACFTYFALYYYYLGRTEGTYSQWSELREQNTDATDSGNFGPVVIHRTQEGEAPEVLEQYKILYNKNKSLIGWLKIADTNIDYPVMQTVDNEYYLSHNLNQEYDKNGSIFLDKDCDVLKPSTNLIVYGHHMQSGKMFGGLDKYSKESYYKEHPTIEFDTIYEEGTWEIMYVFRSKIYASDEIVFKYYQFIDANSEDEFYSNMNEMSKMSLYDTGITASYGDQLLTLSTCDNREADGRFVVVAKKIR